MIRIGILGYGNLGRGVELAVGQNPDMTLVGIFTRRIAKNIVIRCVGRGYDRADPVAIQYQVR